MPPACFCLITLYDLKTKNILTINWLPEFPETSLDELEQNEDEEDEQCNASITKEGNYIYIKMKIINKY